MVKGLDKPVPFVREVRLRPVRASEVPRWNALIREHHYWRPAAIVGQSCRRRPPSPLG